MTDAGMVIVGAGETGARAAVTLRQEGWDGAITLIGEEQHLPYERPPLSKAAMVARDEPAPRIVLDRVRLQQHGIEFLPGRRVIGVDRAARSVVLADGRRIAYRRLLLATGARARRLNVDGAGDDAVLYLRTFTDALALRARLTPGARLAVIGGGFIGLEIAASAVARGCTVTVIELAPRVLTRGVPAELAEAIGARHEAAGVSFRLGAAVERIEANGAGRFVVLSDGSRIACDAIVAGVGAVPETQPAETCGLAIDNGVRVDALLRTSDEDIFAAGDCCSFPHPLYGGRRIRLEAWRNAQDQGVAAARNMLGANQPYAAVPWFWSDQYELTLQIAGLPDAGQRTVSRRPGPCGEQIHFHLAEDGRLVAASALGPVAKIARDIRLAEMLIERRARPEPQALASPDVRLKSLLSTPMEAAP